MSNITANFSHYIIPDYELGDCPRIEKLLSVYESRKYSYRPVGLIYNEDTKELRIPRGFQSSRLSSILGRAIDVNEKPSKFKKMDINLYQEPREKLQTRVIGFLCGLGAKYEYTKRHSQVFCDLNTGKGKTYCATAAMAYFKHKVVIFVPSNISKLAGQWTDGILEHTDKKPKSIITITGSKMCLALLDGEYDDKDIFIFNRATSLSFSKKHGWDKFQEMIEKTQAGVKIIDEAHLDFSTNMKIDCYTNIKRNIYLTSSAARGDRDEDKIFKYVFDSVPILGKELTKEEDNHIMVLVFKFKHHASTNQRIKCKTTEGLSAALYSKYLIDASGAKIEFFTALDKSMKMIFSKYKDKDGKLLILGSTRELLQTISRFLKKNYSEYSVGMYTSDIAKKVRDLELDNDIILATEKGLGTGADIRDLQFLINVIPYSNKVMADQLSGRLRDNGKNVFYIELLNTEFPEANSQFEKRYKYLGKKAKNGKIISLQV